MPPDPDAELDLRHLLHVLWRRAWVIAVFALVGALVGFLWAARQPDLYAATAQVQIRTADLSTIAGGNAASIDREVNTQLEFIRSTQVRDAARTMLADDAGRVQSMSASNVSGTDLVDIRVVSRSPQVAERGANAFAESYVENRRAQLAQVLNEQAQDRRDRAAVVQDRINEIQGQLEGELPSAQVATLQAEYQRLLVEYTELQNAANDFETTAATRASGVEVIEVAVVPTSPFEPTPLRNAALGGVLGLLLGVGLVFLLERLDDRVGAPDQVEALTGVPVLGTIPVHSGKRRFGRHKLPHGDRTVVPLDSPVSEAYRTLQTSIRFSSLGKAKQTLLVTSAVSGEGKTTCTANLAVMLADSGLRVVLVSADLRKPAVASIFGIPETAPGLTSVLLGDANLADCIVPVALASGKQVYVLPAGPLPHNPAELLASVGFGEMIREIEDAGADFILVDCAPVLPVSDPLAAAQHTDGVLVMTVVGESKRHNLVEAIGRLKQVEADVVGVVLNGVPTRGSGYTYYYRYGYGTPTQAPPPATPSPPSSDPDGARLRHTLGTDEHAAVDGNGHAAGFAGSEAVRTSEG